MLQPVLSVGSAADSMYEYMLKQWILEGRKTPVSCQVGCAFPAAAWGQRRGEHGGLGAEKGALSELQCAPARKSSSDHGLMGMSSQLLLELYKSAMTGVRKWLVRDVVAPVGSGAVAALSMADV